MSLITNSNLFWSRVDIRSQSECWEWKLRTVKGYGQHKENGKHQYAHRISWELTYGPIPDGLYVLHRCDNRKCCNPYHLFLGTIADNNDDRDRKGRQVSLKGEEHPASKLTEDAVRHIRASPLPAAELADIWGVSKRAIDLVLTRKTWRHVQ